MLGLGIDNCIDHNIRLFIQQKKTAKMMERSKGILQLPSEILSIIGLKLPTIDFLAFRLVCHWFDLIIQGTQVGRDISGLRVLRTLCGLKWGYKDGSFGKGRVKGIRGVTRDGSGSVRQER